MGEGEEEMDEAAFAGMNAQQRAEAIEQRRKERRKVLPWRERQKQEAEKLLRVRQQLMKDEPGWG